MEPRVKLFYQWSISAFVCAFFLMSLRSSKPTMHFNLNMPHRFLAFLVLKFHVMWTEHIQMLYFASGRYLSRPVNIARIRPAWPVLYLIVTECKSFTTQKHANPIPILYHVHELKSAKIHIQQRTGLYCFTTFTSIGKYYIMMRSRVGRYLHESD